MAITVNGQAKRIGLALSGGGFSTAAYSEVDMKTILRQPVK